MLPKCLITCGDVCHPLLGRETNTTKAKQVGRLHVEHHAEVTGSDVALAHALLSPPSGCSWHRTSGSAPVGFANGASQLGTAEMEDTKDESRIAVRQQGQVLAHFGLPSVMQEQLPWTSGCDLPRQRRDECPDRKEHDLLVVAQGVLEVFTGSTDPRRCRGHGQTPR